MDCCIAFYSCDFSCLRHDTLSFLLVRCLLRLHPCIGKSSISICCSWIAMCVLMSSIVTLYDVISLSLFWSSSLFCYQFPDSACPDHCFICMYYVDCRDCSCCKTPVQGPFVPLAWHMYQVDQSRISAGTGYHVKLMCCVGCLVVFPFMDPKFGHKMSSVRIISCILI